MTKPTLIGLAGYARVGKDTVGEILASDHGYQRRAFADKLRELAAEINPVLNPSTGETYVDAIARHGYEGAKRLYPHELRRFLVALGAGARKVLGYDVWLDAALPLKGDLPPRELTWGSALDDRPTVVTDVRYLNEAKRIRQLGGVVWYIQRTDVGPANDEEHRTISEILLADQFDAILYNDSSIDWLEAKTDELLAGKTHA